MATEVPSSVSSRAQQAETSRVELSKSTRWQIWKREFGKQRSYHLMIIPGIILVVLFSYFPMYGIIIAFKNFNVAKGIMGSAWARQNGFEHFIDFFRSPDVWLVLRNTLLLALFSLLVVQVQPMLFAILLNEVKSQGFKRVNQTISYLPHFVSWVVLAGLIFIAFLPADTGLVNFVLLRLGLIEKPIDFVNSDYTIWPLFIVAEIWKNLGWGAIIYLAVISGIDPQLYEAVEMDGGGRFTKIWYVTWPALQQTFIIFFILKIGNFLSTGFFDQSYLLGTPFNKHMTMVLDVYILRIGLENARYSFATAVGLLKNVVNVILLVSANYLSKRITEKGLF